MIFTILLHDPDWIELWKIHRQENRYNLNLALWRTYEAYYRRRSAREIFQEQKEGGETTQETCQKPEITSITEI